MGVLQEVAMDSLKFHLGPPCFTLLRPAGRKPLKQPYSRAPAAVYYPFGHPTHYAYDLDPRGIRGSRPLRPWVPRSHRSKLFKKVFPDPERNMTGDSPVESDQDKPLPALPEEHPKLEKLFCLQVVGLFIPRRGGGRGAWPRLL
jgi:hypothetical protein